MKRILVIAGIAIVAVIAYTQFTAEPAVNPDPNHIHADFAVWVNGTQLDFSDDRYMSAPPAEETSLMFIPKASAHEGEEDEGEALPGREYLHLHDFNGHVIHSHKPGQTLDDFFHSLGLGISADCLVLDDFLFAQLDADWVRDAARTKRLCSDGTFHWTMIVNGEEIPMNPAHVFSDLDKILLSYSASDTMATEEYAQMTDDACLYSRTCPERGEPPAENCIADPTVPCVEL